jgi:tetratricopeptide (TPR) repeat protein
MTADLDFDLPANSVAFLNSLTSDFLTEAFTDSGNSAKLLAFASLFSFIQSNFTGPTVSIEETQLSLLRSHIPTTFLEDLCFNGEILNHLTKHSELIWIAYSFMRRLSVPCVWVGRTVFVLQKCLTGPSAVLRDLIFANLSGFELAIAQRFYGDIVGFLGSLENIRSDLGFSFRLSGELGRGTKFQQQSTAQLCLVIDDCASLRGGEAPFCRSVAPHGREVLLDSDSAVLERPALDTSAVSPSLTLEELCVLLLESSAILDRGASETRDEGRLMLVNYVLDCNPPFAAVTVALFRKSVIESRDCRSQHRAALQLEAIVNEAALPDPIASLRLKGFFLVEHPTEWEVRREMGLAFLGIGAARTAARVFADHAMWEELAQCCVIAGDPNLGINTLESQTPTAQILCVLGELKNDAGLLEQSWSLSGCRFGRAQRSLGKLLSRESRWSDAVAALEIAIGLNHLYPDAWFTLGCCRMRLERFVEAIAAFQNVVAQRADDAESFSNLAICHLTLGKPQEARNAAWQAVRFDRKNEKLWENFIVIALQARIVKDAIFGVEEVSRESVKWCNCRLLLDIFESVGRNGDEFDRYGRALSSISERADGSFDFYTIYGDFLEASGDRERCYEMRRSALDAVESGGPLDAPAFERLVFAAKKLCKAAADLPGRVRGASQRVRSLSRKYADEFGETSDYASLMALLESLQSG